MNLIFDLYEFKNMIMEMSEIGAANYAKTLAPKTDTMSERKAFRTFGEANVKRWVRENSVDFSRCGRGKNSRKNYSYSQLLAVAKAEKLIKKINNNTLKR